MIPPIRRRQLVHKRGILRNQPVLFETFREEFEVVTILYRSAKLFPFVMWLFIVLSLNTLLSFHLWQAEAKLKDGDCEGQCAKSHVVDRLQLFFRHVWIKLEQEPLLIRILLT